MLTPELSAPKQGGHPITICWAQPPQCLSHVCLSTEFLSSDFLLCVREAILICSEMLYNVYKCCIM